MRISMLRFNLNALASCVFMTAAAHITNGIFRISNVQTQSFLWCSSPRDPCYISRNSSSALLDLYKLVSNLYPYSLDFIIKARVYTVIHMQWFLTEIPKSPPGIYTLKYLGLDTFAAVHVRISNLTTSPGS